MISVHQAKTIITNAIAPPEPAIVNIKDAFDLVLAEEVFSLTDVPPFDQSNMDGYAIRIAEKDSLIEITTVIAAGHDEIAELKMNTAARIFTGAPVPVGADTVVRQEQTKIEGGMLHIDDEPVSQGANIRKKGTDIRKGQSVMKPGTVLTPAAIGYLAATGHSEVKVFLPPSVSIIITGNELAHPGTTLVNGQVFETNAVMLTAALKKYGIDPSKIIFCKDDLEKLTNVLTETINTSDIVLLTGGVSVGDFDYVPKAAENCGVEMKFHRVKQRPGKPLYFGMKNNTAVFGLPGNPSSVLTCFYEYVSMAIRNFLQLPEEKYKEAIVSNSYQKPAGLTHFLKGIFTEGKVELLSAQESYRMSSFARSNCLAILPEDETDFPAGTQIRVHVL